MHPEMVRLMIADRARTAQAQARHGSLVRSLLKARRDRRHAAPEQGVLVPAIPDYVDEAFPVTSRAA
jgi:hypothetical protein